MEILAENAHSPLNRLSAFDALRCLSNQHPQLNIAWGWVNTGGGRNFFDAQELLFTRKINSPKNPSEPDLLTKKLLNNALSCLKQDQWSTFGNTKTLNRVLTYSSFTARQHLSSIFFWSNTDQATRGTELTFNKSERSQIEYITALLGLLHHQRDTKNQLEDIQRHMRYMMVWSESTEWIKGLQEVNKEFHHQLLTRAILLTDANSGAMRLPGPAHDSVDPDSGLLTNRMELNQLLQIEESLRSNGIHLEKLTKIINFDASATNSTSPFPDIHLLICPVDDIRQAGPACIVLAKTLEKAPFSRADQIYLKLLLEQVYSGLEKNLLLTALDGANRSLVRKKNEQQILIEKLQNTQDQLLQSEKMATVGQLAAGVAHEINNPVGFISSNLSSLGEYCHSLLTMINDMTMRAEKSSDQQLIRDLTVIMDTQELGFIKSDLPDLMEASKDGVKRIKAIIQDLKDFSRVDNGKYELADINQVIERTLNIARNELKYEAEVHRDYAELPMAEVVESQVGQVVLNILVNSAQAMEQKGKITIRTALSDDPDYVQICITDTGSGIEQENLPKLFDPFYTTKPVGKCMGLGLSICYGIVKRHQGEIDVISEPGKGSTFTITLPVKQAGALTEK